MYRVNYLAKNFGFVGWDCYTSYDTTVMNKLVEYDVKRFSKMLNEPVTAQILRF